MCFGGSMVASITDLRGELSVNLTPPMISHLSLSPLEERPLCGHGRSTASKMVFIQTNRSVIRLFPCLLKMEPWKRKSQSRVCTSASVICIRIKITPGSPLADYQPSKGVFTPEDSDCRRARPKRKRKLFTPPSNLL
jgi:hypothetical protein